MTISETPFDSASELELQVSNAQTETIVCDVCGIVSVVGLGDVYRSADLELSFGLETAWEYTFNNRLMSSAGWEEFIVCPECGMIHLRSKQQ